MKYQQVSYTALLTTGLALVSSLEAFTTPLQHPSASPMPSAVAASTSLNMSPPRTHITSRSRPSRSSEARRRRSIDVLIHDDDEQEQEEDVTMEDDGKHPKPKLKKEFDLNRESLRLESLETYVLVSVLTATSSRNELTESPPEGADAFLQAVHALLQVISMMSTYSGIYATIVFSLCVLYGKTSLGLKRDHVYDYVLDKTGAQRVRGFQAFLASLGLFLVENGLIATERVPDSIRIPVAVSSLVFTLYIAKDVSEIIENAAPIFTNKIPDEDEENQLDPIEEFFLKVYTLFKPQPPQLEIEIEMNDTDRNPSFINNANNADQRERVKLYTKTEEQ